MKRLIILLVSLAIVVGYTGPTEANTVKKKIEVVKEDATKLDVVFLNFNSELKWQSGYALADSKGNVYYFEDGWCGYQGGKRYCCYPAGSTVQCYPAPLPPPANP